MQSLLQTIIIIIPLAGKALTFEKKLKQRKTISIFPPVILEEGLDETLLNCLLIKKHLGSNEWHVSL